MQHLSNSLNEVIHLVRTYEGGSSKSICYEYYLVFQTFYSLFLYGIIDWILKNFPVRNGRGDQMGKSTYAVEEGAVASVRVRMVGKGGQLSATLVCKH